MQLTKSQQINLIIGLEHIKVPYSIYRHPDGETVVTINDNAQSIASLKRLFESHGALAFFNVAATNLTRTVQVMIHDTLWGVVCEFDIDQTGGITIKRMTLKDELYPLDWSRKIYGAVIMALESELDKEGL